MNAKPIYCLILSTIVVVCIPEARAGKVRLAVTETSITKGSVKGLRHDTWGAVSPDYTKVAYGIFKKERCWVAVNGVKSKEYALIGDNMAFTPNGRLVYLATRSKKPQKTFYVIDGVESKTYSGIGAGTTRFSPDGKHIIYVVNPGSGYQWGVVYDGVEQKIYDEIYAPVFSPDSKHWGYHARVGSTHFQVIDGVEQKKYDQLSIRGLVFSPDSKRMAYRATQNKQNLVVIDGVEGKKYSDTSNPTFSPDSKHYAYRAFITKEGKCFCVLDGKEMMPSWDCMNRQMMFTSDNKVVFIAYDKKKGNKIVIDGVEGKGRYDFYAKNSLQVSKRGGRTAFISGRKDRFCWVVDDKPGRLYTQLKSPPNITFSPDGKRFAYVARRGRRWVMVVNERELAEGAFVHKPIFSPDGKHLAYYITRPCGRCVGRNDVVGKGYQGVYYQTITFSPDSKHLLYAVVRKKDKKSTIVVNGVETEQTYDAVFRKVAFHFTGPDKFRAVMLRNEELFWVDVKIIEDSTGAAENRKPGK